MMLLRTGGRARRARSERPCVRLLIVEKGAEGFASSLPLGEGEDIIVLRQFDDEAPSNLLVRTCARISNVEFEGKRVRRAVIALAPSLDPQVTALRNMLGLAFLSHVNAVGEDSELVLGTEANADQREDIIALVETLVSHPGSRHAPIRVCFVAAREVEQAPDSGIHACSALASGSSNPRALGAP